MVLLLLYE